MQANKVNNPAGEYMVEIIVLCGNCENFKGGLIIKTFE